MSGPRASDFADANVAQWVARELLAGRYVFTAARGWLRWDGMRFGQSADVEVTEEARVWAVEQHTAAAERLSTGQADMDELKRHATLLTAGKLRNVVALARGIPGVLVDAADLDADPWLLNTPAGVVDLRTGDVGPHRPELLLTKLTRGEYRAGYTHTDWDTALTALDEPERLYLQARLGQATTGLPTPDGVMPVLQGAGENGKSLCSTDGPVVALGDYGDTPSAKLLTGRRGGEHSTELADLQGQRLLIAEEMTEEHALDVATLKRVQDVGVIRARRLYKDNVTFRASHSLFVTSNYLPVVNEVDHGTWRRLALVPFRYTFRKEHEALERPEHRRGDAGLKERVKAGESGQHDAIVTWLVDGAIRVHKEGSSALAPTTAVIAATRAWRANADRVLGLWDECLVADPAACVVGSDLFAVFSEWLASRGHRAWAVETFLGRFADHSETRAHGVEQRQVQAHPIDPAAPTSGHYVRVPRSDRTAAIVPRPTPGPAGTAAPNLPLRPVPSRPRVWLGVRWRTPHDSDRDGGDLR